MNDKKTSPSRRFFRNRADVAEIEALKEDLLKKEEELRALQKATELFREEQKTETDLQRAHFLANVSHEIRTPINAIIGYAELILSSGKLPISLEEDMDKLMASSEMLLDIVNNLLDITKLSSGQFMVREAAYDLKQLLSEACSSIQPRIKKEISFELQCDKNVPDWLIGDRLLLKQVLLNLLSNAAKYTIRGTIRLYVHYCEGNLIFAVEDTGIGIKASDFERIFLKFERVHTDVEEQIEGTGIGLSIVRDVLERMNGSISVKSVYGVGSTFTAVIPQIVSEYAVYSSTSTPQVTFSEGIRVLLVDDNEVNLRVMERLLGHFDLTVDTASSGEAALALLKQNSYSLCLLDHMMPIMDGIETLGHIREMDVHTDGNAESAPLPVIALTANAMQGMREFFLEHGFSDYLSKPVTLERLAETLRKWLPMAGLLQSGMADGQATPIRDGDDLKELIESCECIDAGQGLGFAGDYEMLSSSIALFAETITEKQKTIAEALDAKDESRYLIEVHGLKSAANIIGATELSEQAAYLEECAKNKENDEIAYFTPDFLELLSWYKEKLAPICRYERSVMGARSEAKKETPSDPLAMRQELQVLRHLAEVYDLDNIDAWAAKAAAMSFPDAWRSHVHAITEAIRVIDYSAIIASIDKAMEVIV